MSLPWLDRIGDSNPQLFRELKGRLSIRNVAIAIGTSLLGQLLVIVYWLNQIPNALNYSVWAEYCGLRDRYNLSQQEVYRLEEQYRQLQAQFTRYSGREHYDPVKIEQFRGKIEVVKDKLDNLRKVTYQAICPADAIDIQGWWQDHYPKMFVWLSLFVVFALLVVGCYLLINDLAQEERRGTLNFIRLSHQSTWSLAIGKLLGVPILLYLGAILTVPLSLWLGMKAEIPLLEIFSFWTVLIGCCAFFYSASLLLGLVSSWLGGFQPWFGSAAVLVLLIVANANRIQRTPADWLNLFNPSVLLVYLVDRTGSDYTGLPLYQGVIQGWEWFYFPLGATGISVFIFALINYAIATYWIGQSINRRFRNPNATMLSKRQSYLLVACSTVVTLGFALQTPREAYSSQYFQSLYALLLVNLLLFVGLIAALSPDRQSIYDWARYRRERRSARGGFWSSSLIQDLTWGEKSPAWLAVMLNLVIFFVPVGGWILLWDVEANYKLEALTCLILFLTSVLFYTALAQLMLLMKTNKRSLWAASTVVTSIFLPPLVLGMLSINPGKDGGGLWLLTAFPWNAVSLASTTLVFQVLFVQWSVLGLLSLQLTRKLRKAGESASKALLTGRHSV